MAEDTITLPGITVEEPTVAPAPGTAPEAPPSSTPGTANTSPSPSDTSSGAQGPAPLAPLAFGNAGRNNDIATIVVNGKNYSNWTSLRIEARVEPHSTFMFEFTEASPVPLHWYLSDMASGAQVQIYLGDYLAVTGIVLERHVSFDAASHAVRLVGATLTYDISSSTPPVNKMGGMDNKNILQITQALTEHLGLKVRTIGQVNMQPFENVGVQPGGTIISTIERYAKQRTVIIGSDEQGNILLIGPNQAVTSDLQEHLVEGVNILRANAVVSDDARVRNMVAVGQQHGNDDHNGDQSNKQIANALGTSSRNRQLVFTSEISDIPQGLQMRVDMEKIFTEGADITVNCTVQGWFRKDGLPWKMLEYYWLESPSLMLNRLMGAQAVIYEQSDGGGTTTTLELVRPEKLHGSEGDMVSTGNTNPTTNPQDPTATDTTPTGQTNAQSLAEGLQPV